MSPATDQPLRDSHTKMNVMLMSVCVRDRGGGGEPLAKDFD